MESLASVIFQVMWNFLSLHDDIAMSMAMIAAKVIWLYLLYVFICSVMC